jgi:preprotein translocase subunit SecD
MRALLAFTLIAAAAWAQKTSPRISLQVSVAVPCSAKTAGKPMKDPTGAGSICLDRTPFLTERDVEAAEVRHNSEGHLIVFLTFHNEAAMRELQVTLKNVGGRVGIVLEGALISAPHISTGSRFLFIDGNFTQVRAAEIAKSLTK